MEIAKSIMEGREIPTFVQQQWIASQDPGERQKCRRQSEVASPRLLVAS